MDARATPYFVVGLIYIALAAPLIQQRIPPNRWYGFRVRKTLSNEVTWYAANRIAGCDLLKAGLAISATALITSVLARRHPGFAVVAVNFTVFVLSLVTALLHSIVALKRL